MQANVSARVGSSAGNKMLVESEALYSARMIMNAPQFDRMPDVRQTRSGIELQPRTEHGAEGQVRKIPAASQRQDGNR